jgi:hypothetical protein
VASLDAALKFAADRDVDLELDDWTYELMVEEGAAPTTRPAQVLPRTPVWGEHAMRPASLQAVRRTTGFVGLSTAEAVDLARDRDFVYRILDEATTAVTADWSPTRLNLHVIDDKVRAVFLG